MAQRGAAAVTAEERPADSRLVRARRNAALQDWVVPLFHLYLLTRALALPAGEAATTARTFFAILLGVTLLGIIATRAELLPAGTLRAAFYRAAILLPVPASYAGLGYYFRAAQPVLCDPQLRAIDEALLGSTPAEWLVRFNSVGVNEWFSSFYQSYYLVLPACLLLPPLLDRGRRLQEAMVGAAIVGIVGHSAYTLVPALGPYTIISFAEPVHGGFFWKLVRTTVAAEGIPDVFPSLHTAMPVFFTMLAIRHRKARGYRYAWPLLAIISSHIVVATLLLRWHWAIDIAAGLALAGAALALTIPIARHEYFSRLRDDRQPVWEPLVIRKGRVPRAAD